MEKRPRCDFVLVEDECSCRKITIRDIGEYITVTSDVRAVVQWLYINGILGDPDRPLRLYYYDSYNKKDEIIHNGRGEFIEFAMC